MAFCDNLLYLRKKAKITQEDLAAELDVSRQSISKWETGEAYPETDKLIALCDKFGVSMDKLVRGNCCDDAETPPTEEGDSDRDSSESVYTNAREYKKKIRSFALFISLGVFFVLFGVSVCVMFGGVSALFESQTSEIIAIVGGAVLLVFIAAAVFLFVFAGINDENFRRTHPHIGDLFTKEERERFDKTFSIAMPCLVSGILLDVVALIVFCLLAERFAGERVETVMCFIVAAFLLVLGAIVGGLCYMGINRDKRKLAGSKGEGVLTGKAKKLCDGICGVVMLTATAVYLLIGFVWNLWHPGWIVFPVGGILCAIISTIGQIFDKKED